MIFKNDRQTPFCGANCGEVFLHEKSAFDQGLFWLLPRQRCVYEVCQQLYQKVELML